mmetsp:Transcript_27611/g.49815  ORF Transcript_27611/g.49815 Transcript_27611/m.49815 type:complete len:325 (-) Transcript_27611:58-1032(-)
MGCTNRKEEVKSEEEGKEGKEGKEEEAKKPVISLEELKLTPEDIFSKFEQKLHLVNLHAREVALNVRFFSSDCINAAQFSEAFKKCRLRPEQLDDNSYLVQFNEEFHKNSDDGRFKSLKIALLALVLSNDRKEDKYKTFYELCDLDNSKSISKSEMQHMINKILKMVLINFPNFAISKLKESKKRKLFRVQKMYQRVYMPLNQFFLNIIMGKEEVLDEAKFTTAIATTKASYLLSSRELRTFAIEAFDRTREYDLIMTYMSKMNRHLEFELAAESEAIKRSKTARAMKLIEEEQKLTEEPTRKPRESRRPSQQLAISIPKRAGG